MPLKQGKTTALHQAQARTAPSRLLATAWLTVFTLLGAGWPAIAEERRVATTDELKAALEAARPGDEIILEAGTYAGQLSRAELSGVTIRSADRDDPAIIKGGEYGLILSDPTDVTLSDLVFEGQLNNGINIDDGGSYDTPARNIRLFRITVRDMVADGNHDGIKMAGVENFLIDGARVEYWGDGGSAIDFVGCRDGLVQNSYLKHDRLDIGGSGIRPKGGSKNIVIRANRVELPVGKGRGIQAGGSTDAEFFRFADGDKDYEANAITIEGNVIVGSGAAFSWVNIDGGIVHHNFVDRPAPWVMRILNENEGTSIVATKNGQFHDNEIAFATGGEFNSAVNIGDATQAQTFRFARNKWLNVSDATPGGSRPKLPAKETAGVYGKELANASDRPQVWQFAWGKWVVNATLDTKSIEIADYANFKRALRVKSAWFGPLKDRPLSGTWETRSIDSKVLTLAPMSQAILIKPKACPDCQDQ